jgi:hypothetical protein
MGATIIGRVGYNPGMFSGGSYDDVARWLGNFLTSHAKRENVHAEVELEAGDARQDRSYGARLRLGERTTPPIEFDYAEVARDRGSLAWCATLAERTRAIVRDLSAAA